MCVALNVLSCALCINFPFWEPDLHIVTTFRELRSSSLPMTCGLLAHEVKDDKANLAELLKRISYLLQDEMHLLTLHDALQDWVDSQWKDLADLPPNALSNLTYRRPLRKSHRQPRSRECPSTTIPSSMSGTTLVAPRRFFSLSSSKTSSPHSYRSTSPTSRLRPRPVRVHHQHPLRLPPWRSFSLHPPRHLR
jgi:hypothetical protein